MYALLNATVYATAALLCYGRLWLPAIIAVLYGLAMTCSPFLDPPKRRE